MPNHVHLLLKQNREVGVVKFMRKVNGGYALYYNKKYHRKGYLFQGRFKSVHVKDNEQLKTVFVYIHTNPVAFLYPHWKEKGIKNPKKVIDFIENKYRWSSYFDYLGNKNFPSLTSRKFLLRVMGGVEGCKEFVNGWLFYKKELNDLGTVGIE